MIEIKFKLLVFENFKFQIIKIKKYFKLIYWNRGRPFITYYITLILIRYFFSILLLLIYILWTGAILRLLKKESVWNCFCDWFLKYI